MTFRRPPHAVVIGAGVTGLTTALLLQAAGFPVTVVAHFSIDTYIEEAATYVSPKAGAHWRSTANDDDRICGSEAVRLQDVDRVSYEVSNHLVKFPDAGVGSILTFDAFTEKQELPWFKDLVHKFAIMKPEDLPKDAKMGFSYYTFTYDTPKYLAWLARLFKRLGGKLLIKDIRHLDDAAKLYPNAIVVNCSGLGALSLGGVEDNNVYPTRGQTVIVRAPHLKYSISRLGPGVFDYIIPRCDGLVVLGGTSDAHSDNMQPDRVTGDTILARTLELCPQLRRWPGDVPEVVAHRVGLRPTRTGGPRVAGEWREPAAPASIGLRARLVSAVKRAPAPYVVIHNYGHGGAGYQNSWGCAKRVLELCHETWAERASSGGVGSVAAAEKPAETKSATAALSIPGIKPYDAAIRRVLTTGNLKSRL